MHKIKTNGADIRRILACLLLGVFAATTLSACGGDSDDSSSGNPTTPPPGGGGGGGGTVTSNQLTLLVSDSQLPSDVDPTNGSASVTITALVRDDDNVVVEGAVVGFSADSGAIQVTQGTTDATGRALAELTPAGDARNRTITVTATHDGNVTTTDIDVVGTELTIEGPDSLVDGAPGTWTVTLVDAGGTGIEGEVIAVNSAQGNTFSSTSLNTDQSGQVQFTLTANAGIGTDTLSVEAVDFGETASTTVNVSGDTFEFTTPANDGIDVDLGANQPVTVFWQQAGNPQSGQVIEFATTRGTLSSNTATTDANGEASVTITSDEAGSATISASAPGGSPSTTRRVEFVARVPHSINVETDSSQVGPHQPAVITATVKNEGGFPVKGQMVQFHIGPDPTSGGLSQPRSKSNGDGQATTVYTAGSGTSGKDGVTIRAYVPGTGISETVTLTVDQVALWVVIDTGNDLEEPHPAIYSEPWTVFVTDASGNPVPDTEVSLSLSVLRYFKGAWIPIDTDAPPDGEADEWGKGVDSDDDGVIDAIGGTFACLNEDRVLEGVVDFEKALLNGELDTEDLDGDGVLDPGEDINFNGTLDTEDIDGDGVLDAPIPGTVPDNVITNEGGYAFFDLTYPQGRAHWVEVRLEAHVDVFGTEAIAGKEFILKVLTDDVAEVDSSPPGGQRSPYGIVGDCTNPN